MIGFIRYLVSSDKNLYHSVRNLTGFFPVNIHLYKTALRHRSAAKELKDGVKDSYERLEYLGDAILGAVVAHYLFRRFPYKDEGYLTLLRSRMVSRAMLGKISRKFGIDKMVEIDNGVRIIGSVAGDAFEAFIGAIYLDKGYNKASDFIIARIIEVHMDLIEIENTEIDFKSRLVEWAQKEKKKFDFEISEEGEGSSKLFLAKVIIDGEDVGSGKDYFKKGAEQIAANNALLKLIGKDRQ